MKTNNGKRLIAAVAILAMLVCAIAIAIPTAEGDTTYTSTSEAPISLDGSVSSVQSDFPEGEDAVAEGLALTNVGLGNMNLDYTVAGNTIYITGVLNKQDITYKSGLWDGNNTSDSAKVFYDYWKSNNSDKYGLLIQYTKAVTNDGTVTSESGNLVWYIGATTETTAIDVYINGASVKYTVDISRVTLTGETTTVIGDGNDTFTSAQKFDNDVVVAGNTTLNVALDDANRAAIDMTAGGTITILNGATLTINATVADNLSTSVYGIKSTAANLTIDGDGNLEIKIDGEPTTNQGGVAASGIYAAGHTLNIECDVSILNNATSTAADGQNCYGMYATNIKFDGSTSTIYTGNRAIYFSDSLTVTGNSDITVGAYEKGIRGSSNTSNLQVNEGSTVNANLLSQTSGTNAQGNDDRFGIKVGYVTVNGTVTTDGLRTFSSTGSTVSGILNIDYVSNGGATTVTKENPVAIPAGLVMVTGDNGSHIEKGSVLTTITVSGTGSIVIAEGNSIVGKIAADAAESDPTATFGAINDQGENPTYALSPVVVTSKATFTVGSLNMDGGFSGETPIEITGEQELSGTYDTPIIIKNGGKATVPAGEQATFNGPVYFEEGTSFNAIGNVGGSGQLQPAESVKDTSKIAITSTNPSSLQRMVSGLTVTENNSIAETDDTKTLEELSKTNTVIVLTKKYQVTGNEEIPSTVTIYLNGNTLEIAANGTLELNGATVRTGAPAGYDGTAKEGGIISVPDKDNVAGTLILDGADVYAPVDADTEEGATVVLKNTKSYTISNGTITSPIEVGYGNTVNAESITVQSGLRIDVYGNFNVAGSLRITDGTFTVYQGGTATVSGNLNIASDAVIDGVLNVNSNVTVQGSGSDASFTVGATGEVNVASGATFTVARGNSVVTNTLTVVTGGEFNVEGTLAMNGTLSGAVNAYGTVQMNGVIAAGGATVNLFDQTSITVTSISGGALTITDKNAATDAIGDLTGQKSSQGNEVVLTPAKDETIGGITVSVEVTQFIYEGVGSYIADMTIGGTIVSSADGGKVDVTGATGAVEYNADGEKRTGYVYVQDMTLNANTSLEFVNGSVFVEGTLDATAKDNSKADADLGITAGTVTVNGMIQTLDKITANINAGHYETLVDTTTINNYVSADAAIAAIGQAQMNQVTFYGETTATADATIPANALVTIVKGATLNVDAVLTIADNAYVTNEGTIQVDDTLVITNYLATINSVQGIKADVMTESGDDRTYMSLAAAMDSGATEIVLNQDVTIDEDLTIPEGTTVSGDGVDVTVAAGKTLTVDGGLELVRGAVKLVDAADDADMVVNGHVFVNTYAPAPETVDGTKYLDLQDAVDGAFFTKKIEGVQTSIVSGIAYAAENCNEGTVTIYGNVTAGDVTFTAAENKPLTIVVANISATEESTLTVGTLTLVGATLDLCSTTGAPTDGYGTVTGTVAVSASDAVVGSIDADRATGFRLAAGSETTAEGTTNYAYLTGAIEGDVTVSAGIVTVGPYKDARTNDLIVLPDSTLTVVSGATLAVDEAMYVDFAFAGDDEEDALLTVDGTLVVGEGAYMGVGGDAVVNGTVDVVSNEDGSGTLVVDFDNDYIGNLDIIGTLNVSAYSESEYGVVAVGGVLTIGAKPTTLGVGGVLNGNIGINDGSYVKVYAGADIGESVFCKVNVSGSSFSYNTSEEAVTTQYLINGSEYMTVYANGVVNIYDVIDAEVFEISGIKNGVNFDAPYYGTADEDGGDTGLYLLSSWYTSESMAANTVLKDTDKVGKVSAVYAKAEAADVIGTVSEGDGLTLYIDNVPISASSAEYPLSVGTHTVAFTVQAGYNGDNAVITFNGQTVQSGGSITITADMDTFTLTVTGAVPATSGGSTGTSSGDDGMGLTDYLLIILVVLIVIMAIIVALRLMRS